MARTKFFMDTEFIEDGETIKLVSIGIVCEDGCELYMEVDGVDWSKAHPWVIENVKPHLVGECWISPVRGDAQTWDTPLPKSEIAEIIRDFVRIHKGSPEFWTYYGAYDWVVFAQLYGSMVDMPYEYPHFSMDIKQYARDLGDPKLPTQSTTQHNALNDARWTRDTYTWLRTYNLDQLKREKSVAD